MLGYYLYCGASKNTSTMESHITSSHPEYKEVRQRLDSLLGKVVDKKLRSYTEMAEKFRIEIKQFEKFHFRRDFVSEVLKPKLKEMGLSVGPYGDCGKCGSELNYLGPATGMLNCDNCSASYYNRSLDFIAQLA